MFLNPQQMLFSWDLYMSRYIHVSVKFEDCFQLLVTKTGVHGSMYIV